MSGREINADQIWKNSKINETPIFSFNSDNEIENLTTLIYSLKQQMRPNQIIIISDAMCGSTCAVFAKQLL